MRQTTHVFHNGTIVSLGITKGMQVNNPGISELFLYWNRLRAGREAPDRKQIEPVDIRAYLADTFILENGMRQDATFRLAGTRVCAIFGRELKHFSYYSLFSLNDISLIRRLVQSCFRDKSVSVIRFDGISKGKRVQGFETIFLPLEGAGESARLFGAVLADEKPYWLGADPIVESRVTSVRVVDPDKELVFLNNRPSVQVPTLRPSFHVLTTNNEPIPAGVVPGRKFGHLTVISGGLSESGNNKSL